MVINPDKLNENQRAAVLWEGGPLLVLAGPGSGKTLVLTLRVARLVKEDENASVLALTFTNKAAGEMRDRVDNLLGKRTDRTQVSTFHSFAVDVLRQHGSHLGLRPDFSLLTQDADRIAILDSVASSLEDEGNVLPSDRKNLLALVDRLFAESYDGGLEAPSLVETPTWVPQLFSAYCAALVTENRLDFGSLLHFTHKLLVEQHGVARVLRLAWTHICVDEFQDTNRAQYELLRLILNEHPNLFVVADDDQIIYQWNGASPERLQSIRRDYEMEVLQLPENFRCPPEIIELANKLIRHNQFRTKDKKPLTANRSASLDDDVIRYGTYDTPSDEDYAVATDIKGRAINAADCAILARTSKRLESIASALQGAGIEAYISQRKNDFEAPVIKVFMNALRLANSRHDREILRRLCIAWEELTEGSLEAEDVGASAALVGGDFLRAWSDAASVDMTGDALHLVEQIHSSLVDQLEFPRIVDWFLSDGAEPWRDEGDVELHEELATWRGLHEDLVREFGNEHLTLNAYLQRMDLASKTAVPGPHAIRCMTVHGAKGLEFKHVYVIGMAQDVFPSFQALRKGAGSLELEEERRSCFVSITRVQETLTLTRARQYYGYAKEPSQFLREMGIAASP